MRQQGDHCRGVISGISMTGIRSTFTGPRRSYFVITGLRADASTGADVFPARSAALVDCDLARWIGVRVFVIHPVCVQRDAADVTWQHGGMGTRGSRTLTRLVAATQGVSLMSRQPAATFRVSAPAWLVYSICLIQISFSNFKIKSFIVW